MPGEFDRYNMKRVGELTANIAGEDLGRVAGRVERALERSATPPKGATVDVRGQIAPLLRNPRGSGDRARDGDRGHPAFADGQLPISTTGAGRCIHHASGRGWRRADALGHPYYDQPPVVHGVDHGNRRGRRQRDPAGNVCRTATPRAKG